MIKRGLVAAVLAISSPAFSTETALDPSTAYARTQAVLAHYGVQAEPESQTAASGLNSKQTLAGFQSTLKYFDATGTFAKFATWGSGGLTVYRDAGSKQIEDFHVRFASSESDTERDADDFESHLLSASMNPDDAPLGGLKIALDPGHMGGDEWDRRTGKYATDGHGHKLSEGVINLQAALLLKQELETLGAEVMLTHDQIGTVSDAPYESYDSRPWELLAFRESALQPWFTKLLATGPAGPGLYDAFSRSSDFQKVFSSSQRAIYYIHGEDLQARVEKIDAFRPDLTLIIHFDTNDRADEPPTKLQGYDATKTYVTGAYEAVEFASRAQRLSFARHLLHAASWRTSVDLCRNVAHAIHARLGVALQDNGSSVNTRELEPGVFARNLYIPEHLTHPHAVAYVETLFYDNTQEFQALLRPDHILQIGDVKTTYSDRLVEIVAAFRQAIVDTVRASAAPRP